MWADISPLPNQPEPIVRFTDRNDHLYYAYKGHARRYPAGTDWERAAPDMDAWLRTGAKPDEPVAG
jgi:hypothetical protein